MDKNDKKTYNLSADSAIHNHMEDAKFEEIKSLLEKIIIFDNAYKSNILSKAAKLDAGGLAKLQSVLTQAEAWQMAAFEKKMKNDPAAASKLDKLISDKESLEKEIKTEFYAQKDKDQLAKVLSFIEKI